MADKKISQLSSASTPLAGTEVLPIVQSSTTVKVATDDLTVKNVRSNATTGILQIAGPAAAATRVMTVPDANFTSARTDAAQTFTDNQTLGTGNLVVGTAGKGIDFSANGGDVLTQYDEGTWTPVVASGTGAITSYSSSGTYTRIGRQVTITAAINITNNGTGGTYVRVSGLPFTIGGQGASGAVYESAVTGNTCVIQGPNGGTLFNLWTYNNGYPGATGATFNLSFTYIV